MRPGPRAVRPRLADHGLGVLLVVASAAIMLGLAAPALGMHTQTLSLAQLLPWNSPQGSATR